MNPLISIIIPAYNVEKYIIRCLESVSRQTYSPLEVIVIEDGATDSTKDLINTYVKGKPQFQVIHQENQGLSAARNIGISKARGEYITFIDSDDYVADDYVEYLYQMLTDNQGDIAVCAESQFSGETADIKQEDETIVCFDGKQSIEMLLYRKAIKNFACGKLFHSKFFGEDIRFPIGYLFEDLAIMYRLFAKCEKVVVGNQIKYYYYQRENSIMHSSFDERKLKLMDITKEIYQFIEVEHPDLLLAAKSRLFISSIQTLCRIPLHTHQRQVREIKQCVKDVRTDVWKDKKNRQTTRMMAGLCHVSISGVYLLGKLAQRLPFTVNV